MQFLKFVGGYSHNTDSYFVLSGIEIKKNYGNGHVSN